MRLDISQVFFFFIRVIPVIVVIALVGYVFFSFKVEVHTQEMERLNIELAENILASDMVTIKSVFNTNKLVETIQQEKIEKGKDDKYLIQPKPRVCGYGYSVDIIGREKRYCEDAGDCKNLSMNMCALSEANVIEGQHYRCHRQGFLGIFGAKRCDVRCDPAEGDWEDRYEYSYGYHEDDTIINKNIRTYPVGIFEPSSRGFYQSTVTPATMTVALYDSWLTRMACMAEMAYNEKKIQKMGVHKSASNFVFLCKGVKYGCITLKKFDDYLCTYEERGSGLKKTDCTPSEIPVNTFFDALDLYKNTNITIVAYPIKQALVDTNAPDYDLIELHNTKNCERVGNPGFVAREGDTVNTVIFCLETEKDGGYP